MRLRNGLAVAGMALAAFAQPALAQSDKSQLVVGQLQFLTNFHPLIQVNNTKRNVINYALRPITAFDENAENQCVLCETLPTIENGLAEVVDMPDGAKGMRVTIVLREGLAWGDGEPVTAADIAFTVRMANDENIGFTNYNPWDRATEVEVVDDRTAVLILPQVFPSYASWDQILPAHLEQAVYEANPNLDGYVKQTLYNTDPANPGLWNGSFILTEYAIGTQITFEPNPHWPGQAPGLQRIVLSYRDNSSALMQNLLAGEIDAVPVSPGGISFSQMLDLKNSEPDRFAYHIADGTNLERIAMNFDNPILADLRVRQALIHAIDREAITGTLFGGQQAVAHGILSNANPYFSGEITTYAFDPDRSQALLAEAGWTPGPDGICVNGSGERLSLEMGTTAGNQTREQIALVIQSQLKEVCVEIVNTFVPLAEYNGTLARQRQFTGLIMSSIDFSPSTSPRIALGSDAIPKPENNFVGNNFSGYASEAMDAALGELDAALDPATAKKKWAVVQRIFSEELPMLPLYFYARSYVTVPDLTNFRQDTYDPLMTWAEEWRRE